MGVITRLLRRGTGESKKYLKNGNGRTGGVSSRWASGFDITDRIKMGDGSDDVDDGAGHSRREVDGMEEMMGKVEDREQQLLRVRYSKETAWKCLAGH